MKNILITGGAGFIGSHLSLFLRKQGFDVTVLDNLSKQVHGDYPEQTSPLFNSIKDRVRFIYGDVRNSNDLMGAIKDQDAIVHLAAETGTAQSMYEIKKYFDVNIGGTSLIADLLINHKNKVRKLVVASSRAIYGEGKYYCSRDGIVYPGARKQEDLSKGDFKCKCPVCGGVVKLMATSEDSKLSPSSMYGITKQCQEQIILTVAKSLNISAIALRYQNVYGPGQSLMNPYTGILSIFSTQIKNNKDINVYEDGLESRDFVYIDDVVNATFLSLISKDVDQSAFNVGSDIPVNLLTVAETLIKNYNSYAKINISGNYRIGDIRHNYADLNMIFSKLGYKPKVQFDQGVKFFCDWVDKQDINEDRLADSIGELKSKGLFKEGQVN
jgi:dTDP-L-rhamnose 4-epimerase